MHIIIELIGSLIDRRHYFFHVFIYMSIATSLTYIVNPEQRSHSNGNVLRTIRTHGFIYWVTQGTISNLLYQFLNKITINLIYIYNDF